MTFSSTTAGAMKVCACKKTDPFPIRSARSLKVLHETATGGVVILISSPGPKQWRVLVGSALDWRTGKFSSANLAKYHEAQYETNIELKEPIDSDIFRIVADPVRQASVYKAARDEWRKAAAVALLKSGVFSTPPAAEPPVPEAKETSGYIPRAKKAESKPTKFEIDPPNPARYWYESEQDTRVFNDFVAMRLAGHDTNMAITGPSGFGKTEGVIRLAERLGVPCHVINCQVITTPEKWLGQMQVGTEGTYFEVSQHLQWVERNHPDCEGAEFCIMLYDELSRLRPDLGNMTFSLFDGQQGLEVPQMNRRVAMSNKNVVFATLNIGAAYSGTFMLDWALRGRFDMNLERPLPPFDEEVKILTTAYPKLKSSEAEELVRVAEHTRILWKNGEMESPISTRSLLSWARLVSGGYTVKDAAEVTVVPLYVEDGGEDSDRARLRMALDGKVGS